MYLLDNGLMRIRRSVLASVRALEKQMSLLLKGCSALLEKTDQPRQDPVLFTITEHTAKHKPMQIPHQFLPIIATDQDRIETQMQLTGVLLAIASRRTPPFRLA